MKMQTADYYNPRIVSAGIELIDEEDDQSAIEIIDETMSDQFIEDENQFYHALASDTLKAFNDT